VAVRALLRLVARRGFLLAAAVLLYPSAAGAAAEPGELRVAQSFDRSAPGYPQGSVSYLRVRNSRGRAVFSRGFPGDASLRLRLKAADYRVASYQRPCQDDCTKLGPPVDRCSRRAPVFIGQSTRVRAVTIPGQGCRMRVREPPAFPASFRIRAAQRYLRHRGGLNAFALLDSHGRMHGLARRRVYPTASVIKAMLLVAYLRKLEGRRPGASERALLGPMITRSDNASATAIYLRVGDAALRRLARRAGMRRFTLAFSWGLARFSAEDQARFISMYDHLTPPRTRGYARRLLSAVIPRQRWGFSRFARPAGFRIFFKGGWRGTRLGRLVHEVALFERGATRFSLAVLTDGNPSHEHGTATLRGVAARIFGRRAPRGRGAAAADPPGVAPHPPRAGNRATRRAGLANILRYGPGIRLDLRYATRRNLTGEPLPGYCRPWALLLDPVARDLGRVQRHLRRRGHGLLVLDAYRPARATRALVDWARRTGRGHLVSTYIASRSNHNLGSAVDLTLVRFRDGRRLRMGGGYDRLSVRAHTLNASGAALRNRLALKAAMERFGFTNYRREWWHYDHPVRGRRYLDLSLGCEN
jgi:D-alanyl-D-alanine dipeptidase